MCLLFVYLLMKHPFVYMDLILIFHLLRKISSIILAVHNIFELDRSTVLIRSIFGNNVFIVI